MAPRGLLGDDRGPVGVWAENDTSLPPRLLRELSGDDSCDPIADGEAGESLAPVRAVANWSILFKGEADAWLAT